MKVVIARFERSCELKGKNERNRLDVLGLVCRHKIEITEKYLSFAAAVCAGRKRCHDHGMEHLPKKLEICFDITLIQIDANRTKFSSLRLQLRDVKEACLSRRTGPDEREVNGSASLPRVVQVIRDIGYLVSPAEEVAFSADRIFKIERIGKLSQPFKHTTAPL